MSNGTPGGGADQAALLKELEKLQTAGEGRGEERSAEREARERQQAQGLARKLGLDFVDLRDFKIDHELFRSIPVDLMFRYNFVPCTKHEGVMEVVVADPTDVIMIDELEVQLGARLDVKVGTPGAIQEILKKSESSQRVLEEATEGLRLQLLDEDEEVISEESLSIDRITSDQSPIIKLVDSTIISRIKVMSELDISEKRVPQDGRFKMKVKGRAIDFRVSIMPSVHGEDAVIRILDKESANEEFKTLSLTVCGFSDVELKKLRKFIQEPYGMVLVTGPTGSGKTTTLYAALSEIKNEEDKIITIEDPVEYQLPGITQIPVNEKKGLTFARGLRSILRHDPDKIMVGEIRDEETAQIAIQSALTGHLVFTTVHANNVVDVLGRFLNMKVEPYNFVSALNCILAQRLVRLICPACRRQVKATPELLEESGLEVDAYLDQAFFEGVGCIDCNGTGFRGRTAISELLDMSDAIREMILDRRSGAEIKRQAKAEGMKFLRESALEKVTAGQTTLREINKVTFVD